MKLLEIFNTQAKFARFLNKARRIHRDKEGNPFYNYDKVNYINRDTPVTITCPIHGDFLQTPEKHVVDYRGCRKCGQANFVERRKNYNSNSFAEKAHQVHKSKHYGYPLYKYDKVNYQGAKIPVTITCPKHGDFQRTPDDHLGGHGCHKCVKQKEDTLRKLNYWNRIKQTRKELSEKFPKYDFLDSKFHIPRGMLSGTLMIKNIYCKVKKQNGEAHGYFPKNDTFMRIDRVNEYSCPICRNKQQIKQTWEQQQKNQEQ